MSIFNELQTHYSNISSILRKANQSEWTTEHDKINDMMEKEVNPLRISFEKILLREVRTISIFKHLCKYKIR